MRKTGLGKITKVGLVIEQDYVFMNGQAVFHPSALPRHNAEDGRSIGSAQEISNCRPFSSAPRGASCCLSKAAVCAPQAAQTSDPTPPTLRDARVLRCHNTTAPSWGSTVPC